MERYVCIHGHFYQPPRENPWLEAIEVQDSAYPYHDWNERINAECYAPNTASRIVSGDGYILDIVNNYANISFNFGPTLLSWMEGHDPDIYGAIIEADRLSRHRFSGHGSAMAQAYNHMIMPLANSRDKYTQVHWGIEDFERRFGREPEGMWLPETAVDLGTLEILVAAGIRFTVLAPRQARRVRPAGKPDAWQDVEGGRIDPTRVYTCLLPSGRSISLFFYDGPISQGIAFEGLLKTGEGFAHRLAGAFNDSRNWDQLVNIASDGETYGHHHRFGDMALAYAIHYIESQGLAHITNYGEYLERHTPDHVVEIFENSSWSCVHGVERWREDCGCNSGMHAGWQQKWRRPLREALDTLRDSTIPLFETEGRKYLKDPWQARNDYIHVINDRSMDNVKAFLDEHASHPLSETEQVTALKLLGMERCAMLMYTSCGWFFDEISGIETVQVMAYAARCIQLAHDIDPAGLLEQRFVEALEKAPSNVFANGAEAYEKHVKPSMVDILRVAAHYVISSLFVDYPEEQTHHIYSYSVTDEEREPRVAGTRRFATGHATLMANLTWERAEVTYGAFAFGDINVTAGLRYFIADEVYKATRDELAAVFDQGDIPALIRALDKNFPQPYNYTLWHLFRDQRRKVLRAILQPKYDQIDDVYRGIYESNYAIMDFLRSLNTPIPRPLACTADAVLDMGFSRVFGPDITVARLKVLVDDAKKWSIPIDTERLSLSAVSWLDGQVKEVFDKPGEADSTAIMEATSETLKVLNAVPLDLHPWRAQNMFFRLRKDLLPRMEERAGQGDEAAIRWTDAFKELAGLIHIKV